MLIIGNSYPFYSYFFKTLLIQLHICYRNCLSVFRTQLGKEEFASLVNDILDAMLKECRKDDPSYKKEALEACGDVLLALDVDRFVQVYSIVEEILSKVSIVIL